MDNESLIYSFMEISNLPLDEAKRFLEQAGYNLEAAIQNYYDSNTRSEDPLVQNEEEEEEEEEVRPVIPREFNTLVETATARDYQLTTVRMQFSSSFRDFRKEMEQQEQIANGQAPKRRCLEDIFRHPVDIAFNLDFQQAKLKGQQLGKWVAVLINNESLESLAFNRDIFNEERQRIKNVLRKNFIFLRKNCDDLQALRIMQLYNLLDCQTFPIFLIVDSLTGELRKNFNDCTKLTLKMVLKELKKYSSTPDNQLVYNSCNESESDEEPDILPALPSTSKKSTSTSTNVKHVETDEESFASLTSNDISGDEDEHVEEPKVIDSDDESLKNDDTDGPQTHVLLRLDSESHKFKYPAKRTVANLINYIYRNYLVQTGIYDNKTKRFSLISKIHNKCLTALDQEETLEAANIHPSIVLLHNTIDKE